MVSNGSGSRVLMTTNFNILQLKNVRFFLFKKSNFFLQKLLFLPRPPYEGLPRYSRGLQLSNRASSTSKHEISSLSFFLFLWVIFALLDPDPYPDD